MASQMFQQSIMSIFLDQSTQSWTLPKGWTVIGTSNPSETGAGKINYQVEELDAAQKDRFFTCEMQYDVKHWADWASRHNLDEEFISYMMDNCKNYGEDFVGPNLSPRAITSFFESISGLSFGIKENEILISRLGESMCGPKFTSHFISEMRNGRKKIPTAEFIMTADFKLVKNDIINVVGSTSSANYRADISWLIMTRLKHYCKDLKGTQQEVDRFKSLLLEKVFNDNQAYQLARTIILQNKNFTRLLDESDIIDLISK